MAFESDHRATCDHAHMVNRSSVVLRRFATIAACLIAFAVPVLAQPQNAPTRAASLYRQGMAAVQSGDLASARSAFEQVVKLAPGSPEDTIFGLGACSLRGIRQRPFPSFEPLSG